MTDPTHPPAMRGRRLADATVRPAGPRTDLIGLTDAVTPFAVRAAATLRVADLIESGVTRLDDLAGRAGADRDALHRLMRFLTSRGVFAEPAPGEFALTDAARLLLSDHPAGLRLFLDQDGGAGRLDSVLTGLVDTIRTGEPTFPKRYGHSLWEHLAANPDVAASFHAMMATNTGSFAADVASTYDWSRVGHVVDVGGGTGTLLTAILTAHPETRGTLVDQPSAVETARARLTAAGLIERCEPVVGNFFEALPAGGEVYVLLQILHDWPDRECVSILRRCAEAAGAEGRVLIVERVVREDDDQQIVTAMDLRMLLMFGAKERGVAEFGELAAAAGLKVGDTYPTPSGLTIIECLPMPG